MPIYEYIRMILINTIKEDIKVSIRIISKISILVSLSESDEGTSISQKNVYKLQISKAERPTLLHMQESKT